MEIHHVPSFLWFITRMILFFHFILCVSPVFSTGKLSSRGHPRLSNASDQEALLGFMSAITDYDGSLSLPTVWKPNVSFCEWAGIVCSPRRQRVVSLNVSSTGLQEYGLGGRVTTKGHVYSYGIMLLEMLTRKKPTNNMVVEGMHFQKWVTSGFSNRIGEVVDKNLLRTCMNTGEDKDLNCLKQCISVGLRCTKESPEGRPTMMNIVGTLQSIRETFLGIASIPNFQSDITHLLGSTSYITQNNTRDNPSSSTF